MIERSLSWALARLSVAAGAGLIAAPALAGSGQPSPKQINFQEPVTPVAHDIVWLHDYVNIIIFVITAFVLGLMLFVMWRFSEKRNPVPSRTTHNTTVEILWTVLPVFVLVAIAIPSFKLLYFQYAFPPPDLTIKAIGHAWNWTHEYPDQGISVDSVMLQDAEREDAIKAGMPAEPSAAQPGRRQRDPGAGRQGGARARHLQRRDPCLDHPLVRVQGRCRPRPHHRDLVQGDEGGHLFRPMLGAVRQGPRLHAHRRAGGEGPGVQRLERGPEGAGTGRRRGRSSAPPRSSSPSSRRLPTLGRSR